MSIGRSSNPIMQDTYFRNATTLEGEYVDSHQDVMTVEGVIHKTAILFLFTIFGASISWKAVMMNPASLSVFVLPGIIVGLILAIVTSFRPNLAAYTSIPYAIAEGLSLGAVSFVLNESSKGIALNALLATFSVLFIMLTLYRARIIKVTDALRTGIYTATGGIFITYVASMILGFFNIATPLETTGALGIGISVAVCGVAAFNFLLDFEVVERGVEAGAPKHMEWFASFGILVTVIWLYVEALRLFQKLNSRR